MSSGQPPLPGKNASGASLSNGVPGGAETASVLFRWSGQGSSVCVSGTWNGWSKAIPLEATTDAFGRGHLFSRIVKLPLGRYQFRFIIDGDWKYDPGLTFESDAFGNINNVVEVTRTERVRVQEPKSFKDWVSMPGEQARSKWDRASDAMREQAAHRGIVRSQSQEVTLKALTVHERQQLSTAIHEYGLDVTGRDRSLNMSSAASGGGAAVVPPKGLEQPDWTTIPVPTHDATPSSAALDLDPTAAAGNGGACVEAPAEVHESQPRILRSRSLGDLERMSSEYSNSNLMFALHDLKVKGRVEQRVRPISVHREAVAAVGSCQVRSTVRREGKLVLAMVGLPGRGKTHISKAIERHLGWLGMKVGFFSSSDCRRRTLGSRISPDYFDPMDPEAVLSRRKIATQVLTEIIEALKTSIDIAVFDAANCTRLRRKWITETVRDAGLYAQVIFIETLCTQPEIIENNIQQMLLRSPEYRDLTQEEARLDFQRKNAHYMSIYQTVEESEGFPFLKLWDVGHKIVSFRINGYIPGRVMLLLANLHIQPRPIWMSRHGESQYNAAGRIGGDSPLSPRGELYAQRLFQFLRTIYGPKLGADKTEKPELIVWTSTMLRTGMTVAELNKTWEVVKWRCLDEINAGLCDGLTYEEVAKLYPEEYKKRKEDKFNYRYPRGESYQDVFIRLEPVIFEMLRQTEPLLIVGHQAILRILYGYLTGKRPEECCDLAMPLHTIIQLTPRAYECEEVWHSPMSGSTGEDGGNAH